MKLNYKRTICVGFAFFLICAFWQAYDNIVPLMLTNKFGMSQAHSGIIMAIDNVLALFMLPLFGILSDKTNTKLGKRTPYVLIGTIIAVIAFVGLTFADNMQLAKIEVVSKIDDKAALETLYDFDYDSELIAPDGESFVVAEKFSKNEFVSITSVDENGQTNPDYTNYVEPARQAYVRSQTMSDSQPIIIFIAILLVALIAMATFRSPAVALMPDVTIKPLRSKANAVINLMGTAGGIAVLALGAVFATGSVKNSMMNYTVFFSVIAGIMLAALVVFMLTVREPKFVSEMLEESKKYNIDESSEDENGNKRKLSKGEFASLILILASVIFWFMGYNAVTSKYSVYASKVLNLDYNMTLMLAQAAAIVAYIPVGLISSKVGRKKAILAGVVMLCTAFSVAATLKADSSPIIMNCMFALAGIGWATINVNSFPMVVELAKGGDVGKYTGFYYTASMAAQTITPYISGLLMDNYGMRTLFPYAAVFVALAFITMLFVKHGDSKPEATTSLEALDVDA